MEDEQKIIAKGEAISTGKPIHMIPLFVETDDDLLDLPNFVLTEEMQLHLHKSSTSTTLPTAVQHYIAMELLNPEHLSQPDSAIATCLVVTTLHIMFCHTPATRNLYTAEADKGTDVTENDDDHDFSIAHQTWRALNSHIHHCTWETWLHALTFVSQRITLMNSVHPTFVYAQNTIPHLSADDLSRAIIILQNHQKLPSCVSSKSVLRIMKEVQDQSPPRLWAVVCDDTTASNLVQDCFPAVDVTLHNNSNNDDSNSHNEVTMKMVANYEMKTNNCALSGGVDRLQCRNDVLEDRVRKIKSALLPSCTCDRCCYEMTQQHNFDHDSQIKGETPPPWYRGVNVARRLSLAHGYMALGDLDEARCIYETIQDETDTTWKSERADAWHALGAIELSRGRFLAAQRLWSTARRVLESESTIKNHHTRHVGLELQWKKLDCYKYLKPNSQCTSTETKLPHFRKIVPNAFVSQVLSSEACDRVVRWADTGVWTKKRHYAVPTCDIPVHEVKPLLAWFTNFVSDTMRPLLAQQFGTSPFYYVHDGKFID